MLLYDVGLVVDAHQKLSNEIRCLFENHMSDFSVCLFFKLNIFEVVKASLKWWLTVKQNYTFSCNAMQCIIYIFSGLKGADESSHEVIQ